MKISAKSWSSQRSGSRDLFKAAAVLCPDSEYGGDAELHRGDIEKVLRQSVYHDFAKLYSFANLKQRQFLSMYFMRYEIYFLKVCLTNISTTGMFRWICRRLKLFLPSIPV